MVKAALLGLVVVESRKEVLEARFVLLVLVGHLLLELR